MHAALIITGEREVATSQRAQKISRESSSRYQQSSMLSPNLRGAALEIVKAAGYKGLMIADRRRRATIGAADGVRTRGTSLLMALRQISDASGDYPKLLWIFTGTPESVYDSKRGVAGLPPLHDRISFSSSGHFASLRQAQLELKPFDKDRLKNVAMQLRERYPASDRGRLMERISDEFLDQLVEKVTEGFRGGQPWGGSAAVPT